MPTDLGQPFSPLWRGTYPHMLPEDRPIWNSFLDKNVALFERIYYDVRVGGVYPGPEFGEEKMRKMFYDNTAKRIDALGETKDEVWIIEVASRPGLRATGQLLTYLALWWDDPKINKPVKPILVAEHVDEDLQKALTLYGVLVRSPS